MGETRGALQVRTNGVQEINDVFRLIRDELDELHGLRGEADFHAQKTLQNVPLRLVDDSGQLIHAWGTKA